MFRPFEKRRQRKSVVQPVLALAVHAALFSLALRGGSPVLSGEKLVPPISDPGIYVPTLPGSGGSPLPGGTRADPPVSVPIHMPTGLPPFSDIVAGPISLPGAHDPRPFLTLGSGPDTIGAGAMTLTASDLTDPPRALHFAEPRYPEALRQAGIEGSVIVTYVVDISGFVELESIRIVSSDYPAFAEAVMASLGTAQFTPGRVHGRAVRVLVRQVIRFATGS